MLTLLMEKIYAAAPSADEINEATKIDLNKNQDLNVVVGKVFYWMWWIATILIFIYMLIAGIKYITAGGNAEQAKSGMQGLINCIIAIVVLVLSVVLVTTVDRMAHGF